MVHHRNPLGDGAQGITSEASQTWAARRREDRRDPLSAHDAPILSRGCPPVDHQSPRCLRYRRYHGFSVGSMPVDAWVPKSLLLHPFLMSQAVWEKGRPTADTGASGIAPMAGLAADRPRAPFVLGGAGRPTSNSSTKTGLGNQPYRRQLVGRLGAFELERRGRGTRYPAIAPAGGCPLESVKFEVIAKFIARGADLGRRPHSWPTGGCRSAACWPPARWRHTGRRERARSCRASSTTPLPGLFSAAGQGAECAGCRRFVCVLRGAVRAGPGGPPSRFSRHFTDTASGPPAHRARRRRSRSRWLRLRKHHWS